MAQYPQCAEQGQQLLDQLATIKREFEGQVQEDLLEVWSQTVERHEQILIAEERGTIAAKVLTKQAQRIGASVQKIALALLKPETDTRH